MYVVTVTNMGQQFWLGGTVWRFDKERANTFETREAAQAALDKARRFMVPKIYKAARIVEA